MWAFGPDFLFPSLSNICMVVRLSMQLRDRKFFQIYTFWLANCIWQHSKKFCSVCWQFFATPSSFTHSWRVEKCFDLDYFSFLPFYSLTFLTTLFFLYNSLTPHPFLCPSCFIFLYLRVYASPFGRQKPHNQYTLCPIKLIKSLSLLGAWLIKT